MSRVAPAKRQRGCRRRVSLLTQTLEPMTDSAQKDTPWTIDEEKAETFGTHDDIDGTVVYIVSAGDEPQWYAATDTPEEAVAEAIAGIGLNVTPDPFRVSKTSADALGEYEQSLKGLRRAESDARTLRTYDHEEALRLAEEIDSSDANSRIKALDKKIYG